MHSLSFNDAPHINRRLGAKNRRVCFSAADVKILDTGKARGACNLDYLSNIQYIFVQIFPAVELFPCLSASQILHALAERFHDVLRILRGVVLIEGNAHRGLRQLFG